MGRKKEYYKITCTCEDATHFAVAICEKERIDEFKRRCMKSVIDFCDLSSGSVLIAVSASPTEELPEVGTDIHIHPKSNHVFKQESPIDIVDID